MSVNSVNQNQSIIIRDWKPDLSIQETQFVPVDKLKNGSAVKKGAAKIAGAAVSYLTWANMVAYGPSFLAKRAAYALYKTWGVPMIIGKVIAPLAVAPATLAAAKLAAPIIGLGAAYGTYKLIDKGPGLVKKAGSALKKGALSLHNRIWKKKTEQALNLEDLKIERVVSNKI